MIAETLSLDFVGNAAGLQDAVMASQRALQALNRDSSRFSFSIGRVMRTIVTPIASIILSAFAAKKALADFTQSGLPGVTRFNQTLGLMRLSMFRLSSAVGELLAPAAERAARIVTMIADRLEPIIRKISASIPSLAAFFKQLGANVVGVLRPLMPTVFGIIDSVVAKASGMDWGEIWGRIQRAWDVAWRGIVNFLAPILIRLSSLIETVVNLMRDGLAIAYDKARSLADQFGITLPNAINAFQGALEIALVGILVTISTIELSLKNFPLLFSAVAASARLALDTMTNNWRGLADYIIDVLKVVATDGQALIAAIFAGSSATIKVFGENIYDVLVAAFESLSSVFEPLAARLGLVVSRAVTQSIVDALDALPGQSGIADLLRPGANLPWSEIVKQNPLNPQRPDFPALKPIPRFDIKLPDLQGLPAFKGFDRAALDRLNEAVDKIKQTFGPGIAKLVADAIKQAPQLAAALLKGLNFNPGNPAARIDRFSAIGPLLFGTAAANARETNIGNKNPLVPLAQQQIKLTTDQLILQRATARAAERKARIANF